MTTRLGNPFFYAPDDNGNPVPFGELYTYEPGSLVPRATYIDTAGNYNTNPVIMDATGKAIVILDGAYRLIFRTASGALIFDVDNITSVLVEEWISSREASFVSGTTFTTVGNTTGIFEPGRGVRVNNNPALAYSTVSSRSYDGGTDLTTVILTSSVVAAGVVAAAVNITGPNSGITNALSASLASASGAGLVGTTGGSTVQSRINTINTAIDALDYQPYNAALDVPVGGRRKGSDNILYRALIANGPSTTVVNPVGDMSGTWVADNPVNIETPIGSVLIWPGSVPPAGWFECNGQAFSLVTYPGLAAVYPTGNLPDLRGEFIRGWDNGRGVDGGRALLSAQGQAIQSHSHNVSNLRDLETGSGSFTNGGGSVVGALSTDAAGGPETRPRNVAFMFIVRAA